MATFHRTLDRLQALVAAGGCDGEWTDISHGHQFRSRDKAILNWYRGTGTVSYGGPEAAKAKLQATIDSILASDTLSSRTDPRRSISRPVSDRTRRIFVVHGHDETAREQLELILHKLGLQPYVLASTGGSGLTIIEALEREIVDQRSRADFGIVLMTPDDKGYAERDGARAIQPRARQNVVLEMGMVLAALGRSRVVVLRKGYLESPSDAAGIIYIPFNHHVRETVPKLVDRLRDGGFELDSDAITVRRRDDTRLPGPSRSRPGRSSRYRCARLRRRIALHSRAYFSAGDDEGGASQRRRPRACSSSS